MVVSGDGTIHKSGTHTRVDQHTRDMVVDWRSFNLGQKESIHFEQANSNYSVLNRIHDSTASQIWGQVTARGQVWLLNPNGVFFNKTARVNVGGLVAAGLWMSRDDFMSGRYVLDNSRGIGNVVNEGELNASSGSIGLFGLSVVNNGRIRAQKSKVVLASGAQATLDFTGDGLLRFALSAGVSDEMDETDEPAEPAETEVVNTGEIEAKEIELTMHSAVEVLTQVVNNEGILRARRLTKEGGVVRLDAGAHGEVHVGGVVDVSGDDGQAGGQVSVQGRQIDLDGEILADGSTGGTVDLVALDHLQLNGQISARGLYSTAMDTGTDGLAQNVEPLDASATQLSDANEGGYVSVQADVVDVGADTLVDASGHSGGGEILVGGDWQGKNPEIRNAQHTTVVEGAQFKADALAAGDGGKVVFWSDHTTDFAGEISARGGPDGGDGGRAEVSGKQNLRMRGWADLRAPRGLTGKLLLDPGSVRICHTGSAGCAADPAADPADPDIVPLNVFEDGALATQLEMADVEIDTFDATGDGVRNITVDDDVEVEWISSNTLTLTARNDILLQGSTFTGTAGALVLDFGNMLDLGSASLSVGTVTAVGGGGTQTIQGQNIDTTWTITGNGRGTVTAGTQLISFSAFGGTLENLIGGSAVDTFIVDAPHSGNLIGGGGDDHLNMAGLTDILTIVLSDTPDADGFDGSAYGGTVGGGNLLDIDFSGIRQITGGTETDTLQGLNTAGTFTLGIADTYETGGQTLMFDFLEDMTGGTGADTFTVNGAHTGNLIGGKGADTFTVDGAHTGNLIGGEGADTFDINGGTLTGTVIGGSGDDHLDMAGLSTVLAIALSGPPDGNGFDGTVTGSGVAASLMFTGINQVTGGSMTDTLQGLNTAGTFTLQGVGSAEDSTYLANGQTLIFGSMENLTGGSGNDHFAVNGPHIGNLSGGGGDDVFRINAELTGMVAGGADEDRVAINSGGTVTMGVDTGSGNDVVYLNGGTVMMGVNTGDNDDTVFLYGGLIVGDITGGPGDDTFTFGDSGTGTVMGTVDGGADNDHLDMALFRFNALTVSLSGTPDNDGFDGTVTATDTGGNSGGMLMFDGINEVTGGRQADTLQGLAASGTFTLQAMGTDDTYVTNSQTLSFRKLENMEGGAAADIFTVAGAHTGNLIGAGGADVFNINAVLTGRVAGGADADVINVNAGGSVTGMVEGGADGAMLSYAGRTDGVTVTLTGVGMLTGFSGTATDTGTAAPLGGDGFDNIVGLTAGSAMDDNFIGLPTGGMLTGNTLYAATVDGVTRMTSLAGFERLNNPGGTVTPGGMVTGPEQSTVWTIRANEVSYEDAMGMTVTMLNLGTIQGGSMMDTFNVVGDTTVEIDLLGGGGADVYNIGFMLIGDIMGEAGADTINLSYMGNNGSVGGLLGGVMTGGIMDGGADGATLSYAGRTGPVEIALNGLGGVAGFAGTATAVAGGFDDITKVIGGSGTDTLTGGNEASLWTITGNGAGSVAETRTLMFSAMENLSGGSEVDTFTVTGVHTGDLSGGGGNDVFNINQILTGRVIGGGGNDLVNIITGGTVTMDVDTGGGYDAVIVDGGTVMMGVDTGADNDSVQIYDGGMVTMVDTGAGEDSVTIFGGTVTMDVNTGANDDFVSIVGGTVMMDVNTGADNDYVVVFVGQGGRVMGTLDGGSGVDVLAGSDMTDNEWVVSGAMVTVNGVDLMTSNIETLVGGFGMDTFTVDADSSFDLYGNFGADNFIVNALLTGSISSSSWVSPGELLALGLDYEDNDADTITLGTGGSVSGMVDGGKRGATLSYAGRGSSVFRDGLMVTLTGLGADVGFSGTAPDTGGFDNIIDLIGSANRDTLTGWNVATTWTITADGDWMTAETRTLTFSAIENLTGGSATDTFELMDAHTGNLSGGGGDDVFTVNAALRGGILGEGGVDTITMGLDGGISNVGSEVEVDGGADGATLIYVPNYLDDVTVTLTDLGSMIGFAGTGRSNGSVSLDNITGLEVGASIANTNLGDILIGISDMAGTFTVDATNGNTYAVGTNSLSFNDNFNRLIGGEMADTFNVNSFYVGDLDGDDGADTFNINAQLTGDLDGDDGADTFNIDAQVTGDLFGRDGADIFNINAQVTGDLSGGSGANTFNINAQLTGDINGISGTNTFNIDAQMTGDLFGGDEADTFNIDAQLTGDLYGGDEADIFNINAQLIGNLFGGDGVDMITLGIGGRVSRGVFGSTLAANPNDDQDDGATLSYAGRTDAVSVVLDGVDSGPSSLFGFFGDASDTGGFSGITTVIGGSGTDTLTGRNAVGTFTVAGTGNTYVSAMNTLSFASFENLTGGFGADTFTIDVAHTGNLAGGGGDDVFNINQVLTGMITGGTRNDVVNVNTGGTVTMGIDAGTGVDTVALNGGTIMNGVTLGSGADTFDINSGTLTGMVSGDAGDDHLDMAGLSTALTIALSGTPDANGFDGTVTGSGVIASLMFTGINEMTGGTMTDTLQGLDAASAFTLGTVDTYASNSQTLAFSALEHMTGGAGDDTFTINGGHTGDLSSGGGADVFNIDATLTGDLAGGNDADTLNLNTGGVVTGDVDMGAGDDVIMASGGDVTGTLDGGADTDTLQGPDADTTWTANGTTLTVGGVDLTPMNIETLQGGSGVDTFTVMSNFSFNLLGGGGADLFTIDGGILTGDIMGEAGIDTITLEDGSVTGTVDGGADGATLSYTGRTTSVDVELTGTGTVGFAGTATGTGGFDNILTLIGSDSTDADTLTGRNIATTWTISTANAGTLVDSGGTLTFSSMESLTGGSAIDTFDISAALAGSIIGGGGADILTLNTNGLVSGDVDMGAGDDVIMALGGRVVGMLDGGSDTDTLQGPDAATTWTATGATLTVGGMALTPTNIETLQGGSAIDTFVVMSAFEFNLLGGGEADVFTITGALTGAIMGEAGADTITLGNGGSVSGTVDGGAEGATLSYTGRTSAVEVVLTGMGGTVGFAGTATGTGGFDDISTLVGSSDTDTLTGIDAAATFTVATAGSTYVSTNTLAFSAFEHLTGGSAVDTFTVSNAHTGNLVRWRRCRRL